MSMSQEAILCVDDEPIILLSLIHELKNDFGERFLYESALNALDAFKVIEGLTSDGIEVILIISDWLMPGIRGDQFLMQVRSQYPGIKAIMLTGHADESATARLRENNLVLAILRKPWDQMELRDLIDSHCGGSLKGRAAHE
ncbi:MAG TPA: response regulator [bacterium]|nr:response regulator [bacterium]